ncbi:MAG: TolC family type I secretion outer membrane [Gallionellaceae bacterium]|nr:MAG: TolC family type I secretion outer membrane [Gallionellaceae bacterium]
MTFRNSKNRFRFAKLSFSLLMPLALNASVNAMTLTEAVELAWSNDPTYLAAKASLHVSYERTNEAVAGLLPQLTVSANTTANLREYNQHTQPPPAVASPIERFNSNSAQLNLTQPLWKRSSTIAMTQANFALGQAKYQLNAAAQDLLIKLAQAWFDVMQARDGTMPAEAQVRVAQQQLEVSQRGYDKGVLSLTELEDAHAKYEQAIAEHAAAQSELEIKLATLEQIIGPVSLIPPVLVDQFASPKFDSNSLEEWLTQAEEHNPTLLAAQMALYVANEEIRKQRAGHEPTFDLVASYTRSAQDVGISGGQLGFDSRQTAVGLHFNMPLYAGGGQSAKVREALAQCYKAEQELEAARRNARLAAKQAWFTLRVSQVREASGLKSVQSTALALKGEQSARTRGLKANHDVLKAQQQNAVALRDWRKARYDTILSQIKLKAACGQLTSDDLEVLDKALITGQE